MHAYTAKRLHQLGAVLVAVSTAAGWIYDPAGLDVAELVVASTAYGDACVRHDSSRLGAVDPAPTDPPSSLPVDPDPDLGRSHA